MDEDLLEKYFDELDQVQESIENTIDAEAARILEIQHEFAQRRKPLFEARSRIIKQVPGFWLKAVRFCVPMSPARLHMFIRYWIMGTFALFFRDLCFWPPFPKEALHSCFCTDFTRTSATSTLCETGCRSARLWICGLIRGLVSSALFLKDSLPFIPSHDTC
jgi:hypothetical protein